MAVVITCRDFGAPQNKVCHSFHCFPIYLPWSDGWDAMILIFWKLSFKPTYFTLLFTFIKRLFSSSISAIRVVSSVYLRLLIFLPAILIPACASSSLAFCMMYSAYKLKSILHYWMLMIIIMTVILQGHVELQWNTEVRCHKTWSKDNHLKELSKRQIVDLYPTPTEPESLSVELGICIFNTLHGTFIYTKIGEHSLRNPKLKY